MKFFTAGLMMLSGTNNIVLNQNQKILKTIEHKLSVDTDINIFHKDVTPKDFVADGKQVTISGMGPNKLLLNEEQAKLINDTNVKDLKITLTYKAEFITNKVKNSTIVKQSFNDQFKLIGENNQEVNIKNLKNETVKFSIGYKQTEIIHKDKKEVASIQLYPYLKLDLKDFEAGEANGFYSLNITNVSITGMSKAYDLSLLKRKTFTYSFNKHELVNPLEIIKGQNFKEWFAKTYNLQFEFIDEEKTFNNLKFDKFNSEIDSYFLFKVFFKEEYITTGELIQKVAFKIIEVPHQEEPIIKEENKPTEVTKPENKLTDYENGNTSNQVDKPAKKVNAAKYLWLLLIPIFSGIVTLITYFAPFRKRKSKNDIK